MSFLDTKEDEERSNQGIKQLFGTIDFHWRTLPHCKKYVQDLLSQHIFFCQINLNNFFSSDNI